MVEEHNKKLVTGKDLDEYVKKMYPDGAWVFKMCEKDTDKIIRAILVPFDLTKAMNNIKNNLQCTTNDGKICDTCAHEIFYTMAVHMANFMKIPDTSEFMKEKPIGIKGDATQ